MSKKSKKRSNSKYVEEWAQILEGAPTTEPSRQLYFIQLAKTIVKAQEEVEQRKLLFHVTTIGCQMNARDSEKLVGILEAIGYQEAPDEICDFVIYNTCTIRENANNKVYGRLGYLKSFKEKNPHMRIGICGCMMQEPSAQAKIKSSYRFVDIIFGTHNSYKFAELLCRNFILDEMVLEIIEDSPLIVEELPMTRKFAFKTGINIMFGCNNFCSYCIVPYVRGREKSREPEDIIAEIKHVVSQGVIEVMLLGQNVNSYLPSTKMTFAQLLVEVEKIEGLQRIRFMTSNPKDLSDELIQVMAQSKKICRHLHLPVQSGSTEILSKMNRRYTKESYLALVQRLRTSMPDLSITTDIIIGFPGETEQDFQETVDIVKKVQYDAAFTYVYSRRTGTPAAIMEDQIDGATITSRFDRLLAIVQEIAAQKNLLHQDQIMEVLVEEVNPQDNQFLSGKCSNNLMVHFKGTPDLIGKIVLVRLVESKRFYYIGEQVGE